MNARHHLHESTLIGHAAGALPEAFGAVVDSHLAVCPACRRDRQAAEDIGGHLLAQQEGAPLAPGAREAMRARLADEPPSPRRAPLDVVPAPAADDLPAPLRRYFGRRYSSLRWRALGPGVHVVRAQGLADDRGQLMLLRTMPGRSVPMHTHGGNELTMILQGAYDDVLGHFAPGDIADLDGNVKHQPVTAPGVPCICVAATDAPLRFDSWLARLLQPLFRM